MEKLCVYDAIVLIYLDFVLSFESEDVYIIESVGGINATTEQINHNCSSSIHKLFVNKNV